RTSSAAASCVAPITSARPLAPGAGRAPPARGRRGRAGGLGATPERAGPPRGAGASRPGAAARGRRAAPGRRRGQGAFRAVAERGLSPLSPLGVEAVCARVVHQLRGKLGRLDAVAQQPGLPRALARSLQELRMAGARPPGDLGQALEAYEGELRRAALADRA